MEDDLQISRHTAVHWFTAQHAFEHDDVFMCEFPFVSCNEFQVVLADVCKAMCFDF
jgi:hypothetical protein